MKKDYLATKSTGNILNKKFLISILSVIVFFIFSTENISAQADIDVIGNGISIVSPDLTPSTLDDTDFGQVDVTSGSITHTFTIANAGNAPLNLTGASLVLISGK